MPRAVFFKRISYAVFEFALGVVATGVIGLWLIVSGPAVDAFFLNFNSVLSRILGAASMLVCLDMAPRGFMQITRRTPFVELSDDGFLIRDLMALRSRWVRWSTVTGIKEGSVRRRSAIVIAGWFGTRYVLKAALDDRDWRQMLRQATDRWSLAHSEEN